MVLVGSSSLPGTRYGALNQDFVVTSTAFTPQELRQDPHRQQAWILVVGDGHGMLGECCAQYACNSIMEALKSHLRKTSRHPLNTQSVKEIEQFMVDAFHKGHAAAMKPYEEPPRTCIYPKQAPEERRYTLIKHRSGHTVYSHPIAGPRLLEFGTTCSAVIFQGRTLAVAHAGDSLVVVGSECWHGQDITYTGEVLTEKHSGAHIGERKRLERHGGPKRAKIREDDGYITVPFPGGPIGTFSLAMTRALGHKMMSDYGVVPTPTVTVRKIGPKDVCVIVASDGVWEGLGACDAVAEVCTIMAQGGSAEIAAKNLCKTSMALVQALGGRGSRPDNTTAALIIFDEVEGG